MDKIVKLFCRGILTWIECRDRIIELGGDLPKVIELLGTEEEYEAAMKEMLDNQKS